jgi:tRNA (cmo5U34)-methyltransferase
VPKIPSKFEEFWGIKNQRFLKAKEKLTEYMERINLLEPTPSQEISIKEKMDIITAIQSHHYMSKEERYEATKSYYNLLDENGIYVVFENIKPLTEKGIEIGKEYWKNFQISKGKEKEEAKNHVEIFNEEYFPITVEEHLSLLRTCEFSVVEMF